MATSLHWRLHRTDMTSYLASMASKNHNFWLRLERSERWKNLFRAKNQQFTHTVKLRGSSQLTEGISWASWARAELEKIMRAPLPRSAVSARTRAQAVLAAGRPRLSSSRDSRPSRWPKLSYRHEHRSAERKPSTAQLNQYEILRVGLNRAKDRMQDIT